MSDAATSQRSALRFVPLAVFIALAGLFFIRLFAGDASRLPSALIGKSAPAFDLAPLAGLDGIPGLKTGDLQKSHVSIINVFASWCGPCRQEHPTLMQIGADTALKQKGVELYGLSYKDEAAKALGFLQEGGNPFTRVGVDAAGRTAIDFGVYGVPETFVIKGDGTIAYKFVGPLTPAAFEKTLRPEIDKAVGASSGATP